MQYGPSMTVSGSETLEHRPQVEGRDRVLAFAVIAGGVLLAALDGTIVSTALPTIVGDLGGAEHLTWVVTAYLLTQTIATVLAGKLGDIWGRKPMYLGAIVLFVGASALCGMADSMTWLIFMRGLQGIGGGALMVTATALIADIIPLRERGKYQGAMGSVFGVSTVLGPLIGGLLTDNLSWRWVFYVNVPVAIILLPFAIKLLPASKAKAAPKIDYLGIVTISLASALMILATSWGGTEYAWDSVTIISMFAGAALLLVAFILLERRAEAPMLPLYLFRSNVFTVSSILSFVVGFALMGCMTFMPTYLQFVQGVDATSSGLRMLPMVLGLMAASIFAGNTVSTTGRYKPFPVTGSLVMATGMWLLSMLGPSTPYWQVALAMLVLGIGIGLAMQVLVIIVQSTVDYKDLGVATSGVTFLRTMGQAFGSAVFGTIYANNLGPAIEKAIQATGANPKLVSTPAGVAQLTGAQHDAVVSAYSDTIGTMFASAVPVAVLAFLVALFLKTVKLRGLSTASAKDAGSAFASPDGRSSSEVLEAQVANVVSRQFTSTGPELLQGTGLSTTTAWVVRVVAAMQESRGGFASVQAIANRRDIPRPILDPAFDDAIEQGMIERAPEGLTLTERGFDALRSLAHNARKHLLIELNSAADKPLGEEEQAAILGIARKLVLTDSVSTRP